jgi:ribosome-binding ATPase YchF (GTP1/OBG family)
MKIGIAGFAGSGKTTVFQWLTGVKPDPAAATRGQIGMARIPDERLDWLSDQFKPKKTTPATIEFLDTPGLMLTERRDNARRLGILREGAGLVIVLNGHGYPAANWAEELRRFREEMLFADLEVVSNRVSRLQDQQKKPKPAKEREADESELELLTRIVAALEEGRSAATLDLKDEEEKAVRSFQLLTLKSQFVIVNTSDAQIGRALPDDLTALSCESRAVPVKLELELLDLGPEDRQAFMKDLGLTASAQGETLRAIYEAMGQIVFFTIGEDECRAWGLSRGADAVTGAAQIHTDLAKRFVRAEVVSYDDYRRVGSMKEAKHQGVYRLEGKTYIVQDGDIMHIL